MMKFRRIAVVTVALLVLVLSVLPVFAAMGKIESFALTSTSNKDLAGKGSTIGADKKPDAEFAVKISGAGLIAGFSMKNLTTGKEWTTSGSPNVLVAVDSKGEVLNKSFPKVSFLLAADYKLYATDRAAITAEGGEFELTVKFADSSTETARTTIEGSKKNAAAETPAAASASAAGSAKLISSSFLGRGNYDLSDGTKKLGSNMSPDYRFDVSLAGSDTLTGVRIRATGGGAPDKLWDTVPTTNNPLVVVTEQGKGTPLNSDDGSIAITVKDLRDLSFWVDGGDEVAKQDFRLTLLYTGGRIDETDIKQAAAAPAAQSGRRAAAERGVKLKAKPTLSNLDVVGKDRNKKASGEKDYSMLIDVSGEGTITAIAVENENGVGKWDTIPRSKAWLTIIRMGNPLVQANDPTRNFSVSIRIRRSETLELLMEDDGSLGRNRGRLKVSITWDDGGVTEEVLTW